MPIEDAPWSQDPVNPYASPPGTLIPDDAAPSSTRRPVRKSDGTVLPRHLAAIIDNLLAMVAAVASAKAVGDDWPITQLVAAILVYYGYYFAFELAFARTPGKLMTGLVVVPIDGGRCTWRHVAIRSGLRVVEVNPFLLGALPAAVSIIFSRNHQRIGDRLAGTLVIPTWRSGRVKKK